jgi:hypothetical protein
MSYSPAAHFFLFLVQWTDCSLAGALGLLRILIYKVCFFFFPFPEVWYGMVLWCSGFDAMSSLVCVHSSKDPDPRLLSCAGLCRREYHHVHT